MRQGERWQSSGTHECRLLAVCVSRPNAESLARKIAEKSPHTGTQWRDSLTTSQITDLMDSIEETRSLLGENHPFATYMERGIAFHHAGVPTQVLQQIERLASKNVFGKRAARLRD